MDPSKQEEYLTDRLWIETIQCGIDICKWIDVGCLNRIVGVNVSMDVVERAAANDNILGSI